MAEVGRKSIAGERCIVKEKKNLGGEKEIMRGRARKKINTLVVKRKKKDII